MNASILLASDCKTFKDFTNLESDLLAHIRRLVDFSFETLSKEDWTEDEKLRLLESSLRTIKAMAALLANDCTERLEANSSSQNKRIQ